MKLLTAVVAHEGDADGFGVPVGGMGAHDVPATALVHITIAADQEVVADIGPSQAVHVVVLDVAQLGAAGGLGGAVVAGGVVDDGVGLAVGQRGLAGGGASSPFSFRDDGQAKSLCAAQGHD